MKQVSLVVDREREDAHPLHRAVIDTPDLSRAAILLWDGARQTPTTLSWCDGPESVVASLLDDLPIVDAYALSTGSDGTYAFVCQDQHYLARSVVAVVTDPAVLLVPPVRYDDDGSVSFTLVGTHSALRDLVDALGASLDYTVTGLTDYEGADRPTGLTSRQRDALAAAVDVGYYDVPRTGSMADVATRLECAKSTASELVRNAQATVVRAALGDRGQS